jgi:class 3 adenylate cyclase
MVDPTVESVERVVYANLEAAAPWAATIKLTEKQARARVNLGRATLPDVELFARLQFGQAIEVWTTILYVDMRGSTMRAIDLGPRKTYLTMHALLPALTHVATQRNGFVVGFRGDGLFAAYGITQRKRSPPRLLTQGDVAV